MGITNITYSSLGTYLHWIKIVELPSTKDCTHMDSLTRVDFILFKNDNELHADRILLLRRCQISTELLTVQVLSVVKFIDVFTVKGLVIIARF